MKVISKLLVLLVFMSTFVFGQTQFSSVWSLSANQSPTVTGSLNAQNQSLTNMQVSYSSGVQRSSPSGTAGAWPAESNENISRYMQFAVSPIAGYLFTVQAISMSLYTNSGSGMRANVYYSKDSSFISKQQIGSTVSLSSTAPGTPNVNAAINYLVNSGETVYLRVYPWYTSATTGKYMITTNVNISGTGNTSNSLLTSVTSLSNFVQASPTPSEKKNYTLSGTNLTNNVIITPPENYEISTDGGIVWNNSQQPVTLTVNNGNIVGQPVTLSVRLNALVAAEYSGEIKHTSTGTPDKILELKGVRLAEKPTIQSTISYGTITGNTAEINFSGGNGSKRVLVVKPLVVADWQPTDGKSISGVNPNFLLANDQGSGNKVVYDGAGNSVIVSGLSGNTKYYFAVYEYNVGSGNSQSYLISSPGIGNITTQAVASLQTLPTSLNFGAGIINKDTILKSFSLTGEFLTAGGGNISLNVPEGFLLSANAQGGFSGNLVISYTGNSLSQTTIYIKFIPAVIKTYNGLVNINGGGATQVQVTILGNGVNEIINNQSPIGFASLNGGTTGGLGGAVQTITSPAVLADLMSARENKSTTPIILYIQGVLTGYSTQISIKRTANISLIGVGNNATLKGFGMKIRECNNIIVQNITFADCKVDEKDALSIDESFNVWVDHCTFTDSPAVDYQGSSHDGQLDIKNGAYNVTVSNNYFTNHRKTALLGHTPGQTSDSVMKVTYYRNWFDGTYSRNPRIRFAKVHLLNNLYTKAGKPIPAEPTAFGYGIGVTCNAQIYAEGNYFDSVKIPILISQVNDPGETLSGDPTGFIKSVNNHAVGSGALVENLSGYNFTPSNFYAYSAINAQTVKEVVMNNAGVGKITTSVKTEQQPEKPVSFELYQNYPNPFNPETNINYYLSENSQVMLEVVDVLGRTVKSLVNEFQVSGYHSSKFSAKEFSSGVYFYMLRVNEKVITKKMNLLK